MRGMGAKSCLGTTAKATVSIGRVKGVSYLNGWSEVIVEICERDPDKGPEISTGCTCQVSVDWPPSTLS